MTAPSRSSNPSIAPRSTLAISRCWTQLSAVADRMRAEPQAAPPGPEPSPSNVPPGNPSSAASATPGAASPPVSAEQAKDAELSQLNDLVGKANKAIGKVDSLMDGDKR